MLKKSLDDKVVNWTVNIIFFILTVLWLYPLLYILANALSSRYEVFAGNVSILPVEFTLENFEFLLQPQYNIMLGLVNTLYYCALNVVISIVMVFITAYPLSRPDFHGKNFYIFLLVAAVFLNGGMIPTYMTIKTLGMLNTPLALILPGCVGLMSVVVVRTFIKTSVGQDVQEAAMLDGCSDIKLLFMVVIPLCIPVVAIQGLNAFIGQWNSWFPAMLYLKDSNKYPLQYIIRGLMDSAVMNVGSGGNDLDAQEKLIMVEVLKYVAIVLSSFPILIIIPFVAKYFEKGMMIGSLKG